MPQQHSDESNRKLMEEIQGNSDQHPGGGSAEELQAEIQRQHIEKLQERGVPLAQIQTGYTPDPPRGRVDGPLDSPVIQHGVGGKAGLILQKLEVDEPVFILRAKDIFSTMIIAKYLEIVEAYGPSDHEFQETVAETLQDFKDWQGSNTDKVRYPD